jgi:hypothetical protein
VMYFCFLLLTPFLANLSNFSSPSTLSSALPGLHDNYRTATSMWHDVKITPACRGMSLCGRVTSLSDRELFPRFRCSTIATALTAFDLKVLPGSKSTNHDFQVIQFCQANKILPFDTGARSCEDKMPAKILYPTF